jgi:hypothetical protein
LECRCVPATITPTTFDDGGLGSGSLRDAVLQFNADTGTDDDIIQLEAGTYSLTIRNAGNRHETAGLTGDLNLTQTSHRWIIQGAGPSTIIDASQLQDRVFQIVNPGTQLMFQDLVIQGGLAQDDGSDGAQAGTTDALGGGILNNGGVVTLDHVVVQNNMAQAGDALALGANGYNASGGGIYSTGGALTLAGATIANNQGMGGRGGDSALYSQRAGNGGSAAGAGLYVSGGSLDISESTIANNRATGGRGGDAGSVYSSWGGTGGPAEGGGLYVNGGSLSVASSTIASNQGTGGPGGHNGYAGMGEGGGLYVLSSAGTPMVTASTVSGNIVTDAFGYSRGGGILNNGTLTVSNTTLSGNSVTGTDGGGGGIDNSGMLTLSDTMLSQNSAVYGGGIVNGGTLTVSNSTLSGNRGGGILNDFGTLTVSNSTLSGNRGGGILNNGTLTVSNSTLSGNSATDWGGGIVNGGTLTVSNSTLSGNSATNYGGGIFTSGPNPVTLTNVTLTANRASNGGGLYVYPDDTAAPVLHNTLIAGNLRGTTRDDVSGHLDPSGSYNLIGDGTGMTGLTNGVNGNQVGSADAPIDPLLDALDNYGGSTKTHALLPGSPALNVGDPNQLGVPDQRGVVRTGGVNIGAYQASATGFVVSAPATVTAGVPFDVTVTAVDPFDQVAVGYSGTVTFSTTDHDSGVVLPADYSFKADDGGLHTFTNTGRGETTLITPGDQMLTVTDTADVTITGSATVTVDPGGSAPAPGSSPQAFGRGTTEATNPVQNVKSSSTNAVVERFFAAFAEEESSFPWRRWDHTTVVILT